MKKMIVLAVVAAMFFASQAMAGAAPDQTYFDSQFNKLQQSVAEVKGDTTQIVSILGNVFEGTVPRGGNLTKLCNENGWNLIVVMGHNNISDPDTVAAGASFTYPKTTEEFQKALKNGKPLYDAWLAKQKTTFRVNRVKVDTAEIDELNILMANIKEKLAIKDMEIDRLKIREAEITEHLRIKQAEIEDLRIKNAEIQNLKIENFEVKDALFHKLRIKELEIDNLKELLAKAQMRHTELQARPKKAEPMITFALKCDGGICWPLSPKGNYFGIGTLCNARLVGNNKNPLYPADSISAKIEYHSGWSPRVVVRNITVTTEALITAEMRQEIANHLSKISAKKVGQSAKEGDSCYEKTWVVDPKTGKYSVFKDESKS